MERRILVTDSKGFAIEESNHHFFPRKGDTYIKGKEIFIVLYVISEMNEEEFLTTVFVKRSFVHQSQQYNRYYWYL